MRKEQIILILCILWTGGSVAKSFYSSSYGYNYPVESRMVSPPRLRGRNAPTTTPRPLIQQYWNSFVRNLPALPPLRWNMTNSLGNLFAAGAQEIIETPVEMHHRTEKPSRRRRTKTKKNKIRKTLQSSRRGYYDGSYYRNQLHLQPLGVDKNGVMHLYEPSSRKFYALQVESQLSRYDPYSQYNSYNNDGDDSYDEEDSDDPYYQQSRYENEENAFEGEDNVNEEDNVGYEEQQYQPHAQEYDAYNNDYVNYGSDDDNVEVVDNWGYNDDDIFADRKLKGGEINNLQTLAENIRIQKHLLKPETEEDAFQLLSNAKKPIVDSSKQKVRKEVAEKNDEESDRDVWNTVMNKAAKNKRKQTIRRTKTSKKSVKLPRTRENVRYTPVIFTVQE